MFDRILTIINHCTSEKFDKETVDQTQAIYFSQNSKAAETFLLQTKKYSSQDASQLIICIEKENNRLYKQAILINSIFLFLTLICLIGSIWSYSYFFVFIFGIATILWMIKWVRSILRLIWSLKHPYRERQS
ncbi:MAG: hypothetical protein ACXWV9_05765 [Flavisolibacter sp.]